MSRHRSNRLNNTVRDDGYRSPSRERDGHLIDPILSSLVVQVQERDSGDLRCHMRGRQNDDVRQTTFDGSKRNIVDQLIVPWPLMTTPDYAVVSVVEDRYSAPLLRSTAIQTRRTGMATSRLGAKAKK